jgi:hypothetical protein
MAKRLGSGEYESTDVEIRQSAIEARYKFLQILRQRKGNWFYDLFRLFNSDIVPAELLGYEKIDDTVYFFLKYLTSKNPYETETNPEIINVPLINYYRYLFDKADKIKQLENTSEIEGVLDSSEFISQRRNSIKKIIPSWKELKTQKDAKTLYQSLERWAQSYNLNEEWFLDFALEMLCLFKCNFDFKITDSKLSDASSDTSSFWRITFELEVRNAVSQALSDYLHNEVLINQWQGLDDLVSLPAFEYKLKQFKLPPLTWLPRLSSRKGFIEEVNEKLQETISNLRNPMNIWNYSNDDELDKFLSGCRTHLESYCDNIKKQKSENINEADFLPFNLYDLVNATWFPSKKSQEQFIEEILVKLKNQIVNMNKAAKSLNTFTKRDFKAKLTEYCNDIEKLLPKNWKKTPQKYSENKHFEWLVDFQVVPYKNYMEISKENNNVDLKTIREAVKKLAEMVGISLRVPKTGRPKGSKDSEKSIRQLKIHKM